MENVPEMYRDGFAYSMLFWSCTLLVWKLLHLYLRLAIHPAGMDAFLR